MRLGTGLWPGLALAGLAVPAPAGPFDGVYKQAANSECALVGVDGGSIRIADDQFYGVDATCEMADPVDVTGMDGVLYTMKCSGEAPAFEARAFLVNKADGDGIIVVWDGYAFVYDRCALPDDDADTGDVASAAPPATITDAAAPD